MKWLLNRFSSSYFRRLGVAEPPWNPWPVLKMCLQAPSILVYRFPPSLVSKAWARNVAALRALMAPKSKSV